MKGTLFGLLLCIIYTLVYLYLKVPRQLPSGGVTAFTIGFVYEKRNLLGRVHRDARARFRCCETSATVMSIAAAGPQACR